MIPNSRTQAMARTSVHPSRGRLLLLIIVTAALALSLGAPRAAHAAEPRVSDSQIASAVETEIWIDDAVKSNNIDVRVAQGVVTLDGKADNILAKDRAEMITQTIVGVKAVVNLIEVEPSTERDDSELQSAVTTALLIDPATDSYEVDVSVKDGVVTLDGTVDSWPEKQLCTTVAKGVRGVQDVQNNIVVAYTSDRPDNEILPDVEARLKNDVRIDDYLIDVEVSDGEVKLSGTVGSLAEKNRAVADAWVAGVQDVEEDDLEVEWWARDEMRRTSSYVHRTDDELEEAVRDAFLYDPRVSVYGPNVSVSAGTVTLTGVVDNLKAKKAAERDARNVIGVWRVKNHLKVRPETIPSGEELEKRVAAAFSEDPYLERWEIGIDAHDGWIYLTGYVSTSWEKMHAEREARGVKGVVFVVNNLDYEHKWTWKSDWEIRTDTEDHLFWSPFVDEEDVEIQVADGIVTLKGSVETWAERNAAERNAYEAGAKDVINELTVTYRYDGPEFPYWYGPYYYY